VAWNACKRVVQFRIKISALNERPGAGTRFHPAFDRSTVVPGLSRSHADSWPELSRFVLGSPCSGHDHDFVPEKHVRFVASRTFASIHASTPCSPIIHAFIALLISFIIYITHPNHAVLNRSTVVQNRPPPFHLLLYSGEDRVLLFMYRNLALWRARNNLFQSLKTTQDIRKNARSVEFREDAQSETNELVR
jgi:hypothetical protein